MSKANQAMVQKYQNDFLKEVEANVEEGNWVKMCMQCGVCAGSCPLGAAWEHPPQEIFMMIRAGKRDEVLKSESMWMCTSCYNCIVRCPRELPITHIMHGLANYAHRLGLAPKNQPTREFATIFWNNLARKGRISRSWTARAWLFTSVRVRSRTACRSASTARSIGAAGPRSTPWGAAFFRTT